jgi:hypothetical protein
MPSSLILSGKRPKEYEKYTILTFPDWRALEAFAKEVPLKGDAIKSNEKFKSFVESEINSPHYGLFGKNPKTYEEAMQRENFIYYDEYKKIKANVEKKVQEKLQKSSVAEIMKPKFVYNDKQIGEFIYERAAMTFKPKIYTYCPSEKRLVDTINEPIYLYVPTLKRLVEPNEKIIRDGNLMVLDNSKRSIVINAIKKGNKYIEVVNAIKLTNKDGSVEYIELKGEETLIETRKKGIIDVTSSNKKVYLYKETKPKEFNAVKIVVALTKGGLTSWANDFYTGVATAIIVEVLESLGYSVEVVVALGGGRCDGSQCIQFPLKFDGVYMRGRRFFFFTAKKFDELIDLDGLLYTIADPSFHNIKFISLLNSFLSFFGDRIDTETGDPSGTWHGIETDDLVNPLGAFQKALDFENGNQNLLHFYINKVANEQEVVQEVINIALQCENINLEALKKYKSNDFKSI